MKIVWTGDEYIIATDNFLFGYKAEITLRLTNALKVYGLVVNVMSKTGKKYRGV